MQDLLRSLRAIAEPTRLRILALCSRAELSVTELVSILVQSQPRVSRHLRMLLEAGLLERKSEGSRAFFRLTDDVSGSGLVRLLLERLPQDDDTLGLDLERLARIRARRTRQAAEYFRRNAENWEQIQSLYADAERTDGVLHALLAELPPGDLLDIGTGTGRVLRLAAPLVRMAIGIDNSPDMLAIARTSLDRDGLTNCQVRHADMNRLPYPADRFDIVTANMLMHHADDPAVVLGEGARVLKPGGTFVVVDFAPHERLELRDRHAHRWLGFSYQEMDRILREARLEPVQPKCISGGLLTVCAWAARKPPVSRTVELEEETVP